MEAKKKYFPGLSGLGILYMVFNILPYSITKGLARKAIESPFISLSNFGIIEKDGVKFGNNPTDAFITASNKGLPYFQLGFSTFFDAITFSINLPDSDYNQTLVNKFWDLFEKELPNQTVP
jgi:NRPS condensation-like uncharacterized protein